MQRGTHQFIIYMALVLVCLSSSIVEAKTIFRRTDKISENFKQLDLPAEEIDPNVAPPEPQKVETIDPEDVSAATPEATEEDEVESAANEIIDESANEIADSASSASVASSAEPVLSSNSVGSASPSSSASSSGASTTVTAATTAAPVKNEDDKNPISKYCKCTDSHCDCCRNFGLPLIPVRGPGCARISYLGKDEMSVSIKYGDVTLASRRISSKKARPICVGLPGGYSKFCGRVYGLSRAKENFKACLAFELRAEDEVEAALRVSCFKFGPEGLRVAEAEPLPAEVNKEEDDDDDDIFGFAAGGDDDEEEEDDYDDGSDDTETEDDDTDADTETDDYEDDDDEPEAPEDADYGGFSLGGLLAELDDDDDETKPSAATTVSGAAGAAGSAASSTITPASAADQTSRVAQKAENELPQSKDDSGAVANSPTSDVSTSTAEDTSVAASVESFAQSIDSTSTPAPPTEATTTKSKKSKKSKKNKKKKAASEATESDFAYELLNGILDFFN